MNKDITRLNIVHDFMNHLDNSKLTFRNLVINRANWRGSADFNTKMHTIIKPTKSNLNIYTISEMEMIVSTVYADILPTLEKRCYKWNELLNSI